MSVRTATHEDIPALFPLINDSYHVETGDSGTAFKCTTRFLFPSDLSPLVSSGRFLVYTLSDGSLAGALAYSVEGPAGEQRAHFGPFAVSTGARGQGIGRALLAALGERARAEGCLSLDGEVVNHRLDLFPMYLGKLGFRVVGNAPFPAPERLTRPSFFVLIRRNC